MDPLREATDKVMMKRCVELSRIAADEGEFPFGTVIAMNGNIVAEATNRSLREGDVTRHAEMIALSRAQKDLGSLALRGATLYSNVEPCAMCSYCIREAWIGRVVYSLGSPIMGGLSKWNILRDSHLSDCIPIFGPPPEIVSGVLADEVQEAWLRWNPVAWKLVCLRGVLTAPDARGNDVRVLAGHPASVWQNFIIAFRRLSSIRAGGASRIDNNN